MPPRSKGGRLWLRPATHDAAGNLERRSVWIIRDGARFISTGCAAHEIGAAEARLAEYLAGKYEPARRELAIEQIDVADVLNVYYSDRAHRQARPKKLKERIGRLAEFWGGKKLSDVSGKTCLEYEKERGSAGGARRDLEDLRAAIRYHAAQGLHRGSVTVSLPEKGLPRDRWLTRSEAARLVWACYRARETQIVHRGARKGLPVVTAKRPLAHVARFILIGLYTGTRASAIASASPTPDTGRSYVDLDRGVFYRLAIGRRATNKRQPTVPIPHRLLAHLRRWRKVDARAAEKRGDPLPSYFVEWRRRPIKSVKTAFRSAVALAGLDLSRGPITPHTLRHTAATWLMQTATPLWEAAGFLGMSPALIERTYGHHHPDHLAEAATRIGYRHRNGTATREHDKNKSPQKTSQTVETANVHEET